MDQKNQQSTDKSMAALAFSTKISTDLRSKSNNEWKTFQKSFPEHYSQEQKTNETTPNNQPSPQVDMNQMKN